MGTDNMIYEWEGDSTQALASFTFKTRKYIFPKRVKMSAFRVLFVHGDLDDHQVLIDARNDVIRRNLAKIAEGKVDAADGALGGGYGFCVYPIAGDCLEEVPDAPTYAGDLSLVVKIYADGTLKQTKTIYESGVCKIPGGFRARTWEAELVGNVESLQQFDMATSVRELMLEAVEEEGV
jgi:hypothetical protein